MKPVVLKRGERIVAVVPEQCEGPGWSNDVLWVYVEKATTGELRMVSYQFLELTPSLQALHAPGAAMHDALLGSIPVEFERVKP